MNWVFSMLIGTCITLLIDSLRWLIWRKKRPHRLALLALCVLVAPIGYEIGAVSVSDVVVDATGFLNSALIYCVQASSLSVERAYVNTRKFVPAAAELFAREPVTTLQMRDLTQANATTLGALPALARVRTLRVTESKLGAKALEALISNRLTKLRALGLYQAGIDDDGLAHLGDTLFPQLERLDLSGTRVTYNGLGKLLRDPRLAKLGYLGAMWLFPGTDGTGFLAEHLDLPALTHVNLGSSHVGNADLRHLAGNATFRKLRGLRLEHNDLTGAGAIDALAPLTQLEVLDLSTNTFDTAAATALAASKLPLRVLRLHQCRIDDEHLVELSKADFPLKRLDLGYGWPRARGLEAIGTTRWPLETLELWATKIGDDGAHALANAGFTSTIRELSLGYNSFTDAGAAALAAGDWPRLERIAFRGDRIGEAGARALAASKTMPALRWIKFEDMSTPRKPLAALAKRGVVIEM